MVSGSSSRPRCALARRPLDLSPSGAVALAVETCSAAVALLSYPLPLVPVVQLLLPKLQSVVLLAVDLQDGLVLLTIECPPAIMRI